jgi:tellurite resistance protein TerA
VTSDPPGGVSLSKVTLTRSAPTVSLAKQGATGGVLRVNLNWNSRPAGGRGGFFRRREPAVDLDLGCLYEFAAGQRGVVQALGHRRGDFERPPYIRLDQDDRSGSAIGENLFINLDHSDELSRVLVFVFAYQGAFDGANAKVTFHPAVGNPLEVKLENPIAQAKACAVAMLLRHGPDLVLQREVRYTTGFQSELDRMYGWGMRWQDGQPKSLG